MTLLAPSTNCERGELLGSTQPRLATPPLRELTPETSYGFDLIDFARDVLGTPFDPWQEWLSIHVGELLEDGRPRFRQVLIEVARQNGKSLWGHALIKFWLFVERVPLVLGTSTDRTYAKRAWSKICEEAKSNPYLKRELGPNAQRLTIGEEALTTLHDAEYIFAANNGRAARSTTLHKWLCDEIREHHSRDCWDSASNAMAAVPGAQIVCITNRGDENSVVLNSLHDAAAEFIEAGIGDPRLGLFSWSSPPGADPDDIEALAAANPNLGRRVDLEALLASGRRAKRAGGEELTGFRTESMCQHVPLLDPAIDPELWARAGTDTPIDLADHRDKVALCLDVSLDGSHASLVAAAVVDGIVHVDVVKAWDNVADIRRDLGDVAERVRARRFGWLPSGPAAAIAPDLKPRRGHWPPRGTELHEIKGELTSVCMGLSELVAAGAIVQPRDPLLDAHVRNAQRLRRGDAWVFGRRGAGAVDGTYALAGAVHLARTMPPPKPALAIA